MPAILSLTALVVCIRALDSHRSTTASMSFSCATCSIAAIAALVIIELLPLLKEVGLPVRAYSMSKAKAFSNAIFWLAVASRV